MKKLTKKLIAKIEKRELNKRDKEWSIEVRRKWNNCCAYCGSTIRTNAAHIIPREIRHFRHDLDNGVALCPKHHKFSFQWSAHLNPLAFYIWMAKTHADQFTRIIEKWENYQFK